MSQKINAVTPAKSQAPAPSAQKFFPLPKTSFERTLTAARTEAAAPVTHTIRNGESLSKICENALKDAGLPHAHADIHKAVQKIAQANRLANPNRISVGQTLDMSVLVAQPAPPSPPAEAVAKAAAARPQGGGFDTGFQRAQDLANRLKALFPLEPEIPVTTPEKVQFGNTPMFDGVVGITSDFGLRKDPFTGEGEVHDGIDFAAPQATPIRAFGPGTVTFSGWQPGYGKCVIIRHETGLETLYAHNSANLVKVGQKVSADSTIARVGSTGNSTGPHLHFEVRKDGLAVNPHSYLAKSMKVPKAL